MHKRGQRIQITFATLASPVAKLAAKIEHLRPIAALAAFEQL